MTTDHTHLFWARTGTLSLMKGKVAGMKNMTCQLSRKQRENICHFLPKCSKPITTRQKIIQYLLKQPYKENENWIAVKFLFDTGNMELKRNTIQTLEKQRTNYYRAQQHLQPKRNSRQIQRPKRKTDATGKPQSWPSNHILWHPVWDIHYWYPLMHANKSWHYFFFH